MDDGNLGENIQEETEVIEESISHDKRIENDKAHLSPNRWWFASSAFPMIAGTLGPVASAFSICALVRPWRQHRPHGQEVKTAPFVADPIWLTVINAIQLAMAVVSNVFLLLNMTRRVRFTIAQPITIIGWYISAILLISLLATAAGPIYEGFKYPSDELIWSQAFYYGMWAAILYFIDASLMLVTFYGAWTGHYNKDFNLTPSQRTLMLQTIMFLLYLLLGALVFSNIEGWNYLDAVYWADVTLFTVGFGDFRAETNLGRALMMPYALVGVISLGLVVGSIRSLVLERGKRQVDARMEEKKRRRIVRTMTKKGKDEMLEPIRDSQRSMTPQRTDSNMQLPATEFERRKAEFELMRKIQAQTSSRRRWMAMAISTGSWLILWLLGAYIFVKCEENYQGWDYFDGFYFCFVSLTTIGYGDVTPASNAGKSFFVFWSLLALPTMTVLISNAGDTVVKLIRDGTLRLGNVTILPGEEGSFSDDLKYILHRCTFGYAFPDYTEPAPASHMKKMPEAQDSSGDAAAAFIDTEQGSDQNDSRGRSQNPRNGDDGPYSERPDHSRHNSTFTTRVRRSLSRLRDAHEDLPTGSNFHFLLISEIQALTAHLKSQKPHKYSFEEWAWYLKLIGEDESRADTHLKAQPKPKNHHHKRHHNKDVNDSPEKGTEEKTDSEHVTAWSWVGNRSPLMGSQEETEWILDRLMERLRESLSSEGRKQVTSDARRALGADRRRSSYDASRKKHREEHV
ncbi:hypothetical protein NXS19_014102 [Fusarium pseudograminearum]|nr:hypothetical protein NXS19_014102 [Fusarium pseudograminearum]